MNASLLTEKDRDFLLRMIDREDRRTARREAQSAARGFVATPEHRNANTSRRAHLAAVRAKVAALPVAADASVHFHSSDARFCGSPDASRRITFWDGEVTCSACRRAAVGGAR